MGGPSQLGYLAFEVSEIDAWTRFAEGVLGLGVTPTPTGLELRMDGHARRFFLTEGPADDLLALGWAFADDAALGALVDRLEAAGCEVVEGDAAARGVARLVRFLDPAGNPNEAFHGPELAPTPFTSPLVRSGFLADELGLGHVVVRAADKTESFRFYTDVVGFRLSDHIVCEVFGYPVDMSFLHTNPRHHTLALGEGLPKRLHHFMLEVGAMDDVGLGYDRAIRAGVTICNTLGRHPNDRMFSFYAETPSGFQFELGWGGRLVDDATWSPTTYDHISEWGHHPPALLRPRRKGPPR